MTPRIRPFTSADLPAVQALNAANVPAVGVLDEARVDLFTRAADAFWVAVDDDTATVVGLFVGLREGRPYTSPNYRWFAARHDRFAYVDRIALTPAARGTGLADSLYDRWEQAARADGVALLCAEVNVLPPNPRSMAFHARRGMVPVAEVASHGGEGRVAMLEKAV